MPASPDEVTHVLRARLARPLPGAAAMRAWAPQLAYGRHFIPPPRDARSAAVAVLCYPHDGQWWTALTLRPATLSHHASQVSLPGGSLEGAESAEEGAWRELDEELGVPRAALIPLGKLTPLYIFTSNFHVAPCVALVRARPDFHPCPEEVAAVLEAPLAELAREHPAETLVIERAELRFSAPCWSWQGERVWGASAMILAEWGAVWREVAPALGEAPARPLSGCHLPR
jgi:8-oxo-dGTP pyrophosphatase MutT (NUDIX family)